MIFQERGRGMNLGERIYQLRTQRNMSQGDLAEQLDVSRQSVSKWENNSAVPDLDKLLKLSELFELTLDELVKGDTVPEKQVQQIVTVVQREPMAGRKVAGIVLLCMSFTALLLLTVMGGFLTGLILAFPFLVCGLVCLFAKRFTALYCAWSVLLMGLPFMHYATSIQWRLIFQTFRFEESWNYTRLIAAWIVFFIMAAVVVWTVWAYRKDPIDLTGKGRLRYFGGWMLYLVLRFGVRLGIGTYWLYPLLEIARLVSLTVLLTMTVRWLRQKKGK